MARIALPALNLLMQSSLHFVTYVARGRSVFIATDEFLPCTTDFEPAAILLLTISFGFLSAIVAVVGRRV